MPNIQQMIHSRSTYHSQDGVQDDVQLHDGGVFVVQNGPRQFKHAVVCGQVQVVHYILVTAHLLRARPVYCNTVSRERFVLKLQ